MFAFALVFTLITLVAQADSSEPGGAGADAIFVSPVDVPTEQPVRGVRSANSVRVAITVDPIRMARAIGEAVLFPVELQAGMSVANQEFEITRAKASLLRAKFSRVVPLHLFSFYRNLDRGIEWGADLIGFRVPVRVTKNGGLVVLPGMELGIRHYAAPVDTTAAHASFIVEARAARELVRDWASAGLIARLRYDLDSAVSGFEEGAMGYLSFLLDEDHRLYARVYVGLEHQASRDELGLPTLNLFGGFGFYGEFSQAK